MGIFQSGSPSNWYLGHIPFNTVGKIGLIKRDEAALRAELTQKLSNQHRLFLVVNNNSALIFPLLLMMPLKMPLLTM